MLRFVLIGIGIGAVSEGAAYAQRLWLYRSPIYPLLNVLVVFGLIMGALASRVGVWGLGPVFAAGAGVGLVYETLNLTVLDWWYFPGERLYGLRGHTAIVIAISLAWGTVPLATALARGLTAS